MATNEFKVTVHMVASVDGMIAKNDNSISWFDTFSNYEKGVVEEDPATFLQTIDCYVMGSHTYEFALTLSKDHGWVYGDKPTIVLTSRTLQMDMPQIESYSGDLHRLVNEELKPKYKNVWVVGGPMLIKDFIRLQLADEICISILPIILGEGLPFFDHIGLEQALDLKDTKAYKNGMVTLCYEVRK